MSNASPRSIKVKTEARTRPDMMWHDQTGDHAVRLKTAKIEQPEVLVGGTELARLVAEADTHLASMRKIVQ